MSRGLQRISVKNFGMLEEVDVELGRLNVLVGPNGSGKSTLLKVIRFLGDAARMQLGPAVDLYGGFERLATRPPDGSTRARPAFITLGVEAMLTKHASRNAPDEYQLRFRAPAGSRLLIRHETLAFKRTGGRGRRITLTGTKLEIRKDTPGARTSAPAELKLDVDKGAIGLATLPQLGERYGASEVRKIQELFTSFRVFDIDAVAARAPSPVGGSQALRADAANLAGFLHQLRKDEARFKDLERDARQMVPGFHRFEFRSLGGAEEQVAVDVVDQGRKGVTQLADASFGTIRALALLALVYDPEPPILTCIEEIDHGLHPHVFDRLVELLRAASKHTQFLIATHSPALVNRLRPSELIVCERDEATGLARIPAIDPEKVAKTKEKSPYGLGELWFSGALGGVPK